MPTVLFTSALQRFLAAPSAEVEAATVGDALAAVFQARPQLKGYVITTPRQSAQVLLTTPRGDPLLAAWQYGLGRALAWTSDLKVFATDKEELFEVIFAPIDEKVFNDRVRDPAGGKK